MNVRVRLYAWLREAAERGEMQIELAPPATVEACWAELSSRIPSLALQRPRLQVAVNRQYATFETALSDGDEVAFIPPVSGG